LIVVVEVGAQREGGITQERRAELVALRILAGFDEED
jgi:hypothetical protein